MEVPDETAHRDDRLCVHVWGAHAARRRRTGTRGAVRPPHQQTSDHVAILHEIIHEVRIIPLDGRDHVDSRIRQYWGDSRGHWEGDTLVVEVTNFSDKTFGTQQPAGSYRGGGRGQRVVERFTRINDGTLEYRAMVEDPRGFTEPWTVVVPLLRDDDYMLYEYACHEGNYGLEQILKAHLGPGRSDSDGR